MVTEHGTRRQGSSEACFRLGKNRTLLMFLKNTLKPCNILPKSRDYRQGSTGTHTLRAMTPQVGGDGPGREGSQISFLWFYTNIICALLKTSV